MILVDTSVWIEYLAGRTTSETRAFDKFLGVAELGIGDLCLLEVLHGARDEAHARTLEKAMTPFQTIVLSSDEIARKAARNFRLMRAQAFTIRSTIDLIIGTWCIENHVMLLHRDRDFAAMEKVLGLRSAVAP